MAERKKSEFSPPTTGGVSLLTVFAVLCLTVFALLSLSTVRADVRLSDLSAKAVEEYYAADCKAQEVLAQLRRGQLPTDVEVTVTNGFEAASYDIIYGYAVPISDSQELQVAVSFLGRDYTVLRWQAVPIGDRTPDEGLGVWDGTLF